MDTRSLLQALIEAGQTVDVATVRGLACAGRADAVRRFAADVRERLFDVLELPQADRAALVKAVAVLEDTVGGIGSPTLVDPLLSSLPLDERDELAHWIMEHTACFAGSFVEGFERSREDRALRKANPEYYAKLDAERHAAYAAEREAERRSVEARERVHLAEATARLPNAVRRGDALAVAALLARGASPFAESPDGQDLVAYAMRCGHPGIADQLRAARVPPDAAATPTDAAS